MKTHVEFRSNAFPPYGDEETEVNPGRYGKRLAEFLVQGLKQKGFQTSGLHAEDWGWLVPIRNKSFRLWIGCGNYDEHDDGFLCFIEPHQRYIRKFPFLRRVDTSEMVGALQRAIDDVLSSRSAVREKRWWSYDEFNRPKI